MSGSAPAHSATEEGAGAATGSGPSLAGSGCCMPAAPSKDKGTTGDTRAMLPPFVRCALSLVAAAAATLRLLLVLPIVAAAEADSAFAWPSEGVVEISIASRRSSSSILACIAARSASTLGELELEEGR